MQNVVATFNLGIDSMDLKHLAMSTLYVEYNPKKFAAATCRIVYPRTTALIFASGNMVCTGAKDELRARLAGRKYVYILQNAGFNVKFCNFKIQNLVASVNVGGLLKLREIARDYGACCGYEPDLFPGLVFRVENPKIVYLCFRSGKIVITGGQAREAVMQSFEHVYTVILRQYIEQDGMSSNSAIYRHECAQSTNC
mgnify:CR=1 FL=1